MARFAVCLMLAAVTFSGCLGGDDAGVDAADATADDPGPTMADFNRTVVSESGAIRATAYTDTPAGSAGWYGVITNTHHEFSLPDDVQDASLVATLTWDSTGPAAPELHLHGPDDAGGMATGASPVIIEVPDAPTGLWELYVMSGGVAAEITFELEAVAAGTVAAS